MYAKPIFDNKTRFVQNAAGLYVVWPMRGDGLFGNDSLANVNWTPSGQVHSIIVDRELDRDERTRFYNSPIMFWGVLYEPLSKKDGSCAAALVCFRWSQKETIISDQTPTATDQKVMV